AAFPAPLPWGKEGITVLDAATYFQNALKMIGFRAGDPRIRHITASLNHAQRVLIYRVGTLGAAKATATLDTLTITAKYLGTRGNDITVAIQEDIDDAGKFNVYTYLQGEEMDVQTVATAEELQSNDFVDFSGTGDLTETAGTSLTGGTDGTVSAGDYTDALTAFESEDFNVLGIPSDD